MAMRMPLLGHHALHVGHAVYGAALERGADELRVGVEADRDAQLSTLAGEVGQDRLSQAAEADDGHVLVHGAVQKALDAGQAGIHLIAAVGAARIAYDHEVPAHLRGADPG